MTFFIIIFFGLILFIFIVASNTPKPSPFETNNFDLESTDSDEIFPYYAKRQVLSKPEQILYFRLIEALPDHVVLAQVQLSRFLGVNKGNNYQAWINRVNRMSADFVICNKDTSIVAVIELDDSSHERPDRQIADAKKNAALLSAQIKLIRWDVQSLPDLAHIQFDVLRVQP